MLLRDNGGGDVQRGDVAATHGYRFDQLQAVRGFLVGKGFVWTVMVLERKRDAF